MPPKKPPLTPERQAQILAELQRDREQREHGYRDQALKLFPHVCASCGREFSGKRLKELTVHHRDHNYKNNPPDGSNWELLCLYCHDHEHERNQMQGYGGGQSAAPTGPTSSPIVSPFEKLDELLKPKDTPE